MRLSLIQLRTPEAEDRSFLINAWLKSFRDSPIGKTLTDDVYYKSFSQSVIAILDAPTTITTLATLKEEPSVILGFIVADKSQPLTVVHYAYTKWAYRKSGIAQHLFQSLKPTTPTVCTHINRKFHELRSTNFLPMLTTREHETLQQTNQSFAEWFLDHAHEFRTHRKQLEQEREQYEKTRDRTSIQRPMPKVG
jgi:hypothetical protein